VELRNKLVVYFYTQPKIELAICKSLGDVERDYLGSKITEVTESILFEKTPFKYNLETYLNQIIAHSSNVDNEKQVNRLIDKFIYEFENTSTLHRRSDGYRFYFYYNIALHVAIQLNQLSRGNDQFIFLPKYFTAKTLMQDELKDFYDLRGTLFLVDANKQKRKLLDFFYAGIMPLISMEQLAEVKDFCEATFHKAFFWNFRDASVNNPKLRSDLIFRTATMSLFQSEPEFQELLIEKKIRTVIDLRADREIEELPYDDEAQSLFKYVRAPFDPWNQPDWFKKNHHQGTDQEIAYRFFALGCKDKIKTVMEAILDEQEGSVAIHCFAGKDRTGIIISLLHLLTSPPIQAIYADYLASESDVIVDRLKLVLNIVKEHGGIADYLVDCGLTTNQIQQLKNKLIN